MNVEIDRTKVVVKFGKRKPKRVNNGYYEYDSLDCVEFVPVKKPPPATGWDAVGAEH